MKICTRCTITQPLTAFSKSAVNGDGLQNICKTCNKLYLKQHLINISASNAKFTDIELRVNTPSKYCKDCNTIHTSDLFDLDRTKKSGLATYCKVCSGKRIAKYQQDHKDERNQYFKDYYQKNIESMRSYLRQYKSYRYANDTEYKLLECYRGIVTNALTKSHKSRTEKTIFLLGCKISELKLYLESQFTEGMTWENYGIKGWQVDHKKPCAAFDLSDINQRLQCFHFSNLQPLWAKENRDKGSHYNGKKYFHHKINNII